MYTFFFTEVLFVEIRKAKNEGWGIYNGPMAVPSFTSILKREALGF